MTEENTGMDLDALKERWTDYDHTLERSLRLNTRLLRTSTLRRADTAMRRLSRWLWIELIVDFALLVWLGSFLADHAHEGRFLLPGAVLQVTVILLAIAGIHQLAAIAGLDYDTPIVAIQKRLESLRVHRLFVARMVLMLAPLLWTPILIVTLKGLLGVDAYATFTAGWLVANLVVGLAVIPVTIWVARRYAERLRRFPLVQRLMRDLAGTHLNAAMGFLDSLARFEEEQEQPLG